MPTVTVKLSKAEHAAVMKRVEGINAKRLQEIGIGAIPETGDQKTSALDELRPPRRMDAQGLPPGRPSLRWRSLVAPAGHVPVLGAAVRRLLVGCLRGANRHRSMRTGD